MAEQEAKKVAVDKILYGKEFDCVSTGRTFNTECHHEDGTVTTRKKTMYVVNTEDEAICAALDKYGKSVSDKYQRLNGKPTMWLFSTLPTCGAFFPEDSIWPAIIDDSASVIAHAESLIASGNAAKARMAEMLLDKETAEVFAQFQSRRRNRG